MAKKSSSSSRPSQRGGDPSRVTGDRFGTKSVKNTLASLGQLGITGRVDDSGSTNSQLQSRNLAALAESARSFPMAMNSFSGYRPVKEGGTKNHATLGAVDTGLYNPMTDQELNSYQNRLTAPAYQAMAKSWFDSLSPEDQAQAMSGNYFGDKNFADHMHTQLGNKNAHYGDIENGFNREAREAGFDRPMPTPSLDNGHFLLGDIQDALGPHATKNMSAAQIKAELAHLAQGVAQGWGTSYNPDGTVNQNTLNVMTPVGTQSIEHGKKLAAKPGELGSKVQQMPGTPPVTAGDRMRSILGLPATLSVEAGTAIQNGVISLSQLAAEVAGASAAAQSPQAAPPSSFPSRPAGPVSSNQFNPQGSALPGAVQRGAVNPNAGVIGAAPASDMRDSPAARMHAGLAAEGVKASFDPASGRVGFTPTGPLGPQGAADAANAGGRNSTPAGVRGFPQGAPTNVGPVAAADRAGNAVAQGGLGGLIGSLGRAAMATPSSPPARAAPSYGGPMAAADASNRARPLSSLGLPAGLKTDYAGLGVPSLAIGPAPTVADMETNTLSQQIADALGTGYAPGAITNVKPGEVGYKAPAAAPLAPKPAAARPAAPAARPAARPQPHPQSPFAPGTDAFDSAGQLVGTVNGYGKFQAPSFAAGTTVTDQAGNVVGHYDSTGKMQKAEPLGFFGSIAASLSNMLGGNAAGSNGGQAAGIGGRLSAAPVALGLKGAGWGSSGNSGMGGGYRTSNEGGNLHG